MTKKCWIFLLGLVLVCGCARVKVAPVDHEGVYREGIRFYRPHPYLLVTEKLTSQGRSLEGNAPKLVYNTFNFSWLNF